MKKALSRLGRTLAFLLVFLIIYYFVSETLKFKYYDGIQPMQNFYALPEDTVDVLLLGSSHMGLGVNSAALWEQHGIAAYNCWGSAQPIWNTYFYLKECLKTQDPKLVVMDTYVVTVDAEYAEYERVVKNIFGMRFSRDKLEAIKVSASPDIRTSILLEFPTFHYRYSDLTAADFSSYFWQRDPSIQKLISSDDVYPIHILDTSKVKGTRELPEKAEEYLNKIIELCKERNIPLLLVTSPYELSEDEQKRFNKVKSIAKKNDLVYLNFNENYEELGIDPEVDFCDQSHFNNNGIAKYSKYLADYLKSHYDLPDRRKDKNHIWNKVTDAADSCVYSLDRQFQGGGLNYLDTGVKLYDNPFSSYTILTQIDTTAIGEDMVYMSCYAEGAGNYRGLLMRKEDDGRIHFTFDLMSGIAIEPTGDIMNLALVKDGLFYQAYADGKKAGDFTVSEFKAYDGTLLLGCEMGEDGRPMRYSDVKVLDLKVYNTVLEEDTIRNWKPAKLPKAKSYQVPVAGSRADYELAYSFEGNGIDDYVDTAIPLYDEADKSWTLLTQFKKGDDWGEGVYLGCFAEDPDNYRGVLIREGYEPGSLNILYGDRGMYANVEEKSDVTVAIVKDRIAYTIYVNGVKVIDGENVPVDSYPGNLMIGVQELPDGAKFRYSGTTVYNFEYYDGIMDEADILAWAPEHKPAMERETGSSVEYEMKNAFLGNGLNEYRDTGIQLYDVSDKDWTLTMKFRKNDEPISTLVSCFAGTPNSYRGLLINLVDGATLSLTLGQTGHSIALTPTPTQTLKIVKKGFKYTVYVNGKEELQVESRSPAYDGTLLVGCRTDANGKPFGFSEAQILELSVTGE